MKTGALTALLLAVSLAGCSANATPTAAIKSTPAPSTTTATPTPTVSYASENEVASIIAGHQKMWRDVEEKGGECRLASVLGEDSGISEVELLTCYTNEITAGLEAQIAIRELDNLTIPPSMESLVDETTRTLQVMADVDLEKICGPAMSIPKDSKACSEAMGTRMMSYSLVTGVLDKWAPYL